MQVGSLVECIIPEKYKFTINGEVYPIVGCIYTVRDFTDDKNAIVVDEIINPKVHYLGIGYGEIYFMANRFREVQPPMDLSELMEETKLITHKLSI